MKMFKSVSFRRILAYLIDIMLVSLISSMFASIELLNPYLNKQQEIANEYTEKVNDFINDDSQIDINEFTSSDFMKEYTYEISYYSIYESIISVVFTILYFVVFQYYNNGKTVGKALFDIVVIDKDRKKASIKQLLLRSLIIHSLLTSIISIIGIYTLNKESYLTLSYIIAFIEMGIMIACIILLIFREDKRLVHDLFAGTKVISCDELDEQSKVKEAKILTKSSRKNKKKENNK